MGTIGHHDASLDAAGSWAGAFRSFRSVLPDAFRIGHAQTGGDWYRANKPRYHQYIPVNIGFAIKKSSTILTGTQGPYNESSQRGAALITALRAQMAALYSKAGSHE